MELAQNKAAEYDDDNEENVNTAQARIVNFPSPRTDRAPSRPKAVLTDLQISQILNDCRVEIETTMDLLDRGQSMIDEATPYLKASYTRKEFRHLPTLLAVIERDYGGILPPYREMLKKNRSLAHAIWLEHGGRAEVLKYFGATNDTIVPFVLTLAFRTFFNPTPLLDLRQSLCSSQHWLWGDLCWEILSGELSDEGQRELQRKVDCGQDPATARREVLMAYKGRSSSIVSRSFRPSDDWDNPAKLLRQLAQLTRRWRPYVPPEDADHVFISVPLAAQGTARPRAYWSTNCISNDIKWTYSLKKFRERHNHPKYSLQTFRITGTDLIYEMTDGDTEAARAVLNHKNADTTRNAYQTNSNNKRDGDRLAAMTGRRTRFAETGGHSRNDYVACTPGFGCADPYDSPILGQRKGRLCTAFGRCPACPMSLAATTNARSVAYMLRLEAAFVDAASKVDMSRYNFTIGPELQALKSEWLPRVSDGVLATARQILPSLPTFPNIE
ncbi:hypothetical protein GCM10011611_24960 [Aliidongia dinghuensis]|uniref:Uncharacterized protein n=2 Tax=Aliidongia dinghuensis TaxID=1867774 RepID=A0A8J2YUJ4_9PROT|nr:hypothetical protein GCM10011611_24960 [Aliidongia dinghuensis]